MVSVDGAAAPVALHNNTEKADAEALRLATKHQNTVVRVLALLHSHKVSATKPVHEVF